MPWEDLVTSNLRKYFNLPMSLILNLECRNCLMEDILAMSFPARTTSSTYTNRAVKELVLCLMKSMELEGHC